MVVIKLYTSIPYGGGIDKASIMNLPVIKSVGSNDLLTINRSPHGNKTAREQFKLNGIKYTAIAIIKSMKDTESLLSYIGSIGQVQGINNIDIIVSFEYNIGYDIDNLYSCL